VIFEGYHSDVSSPLTKVNTTAFGSAAFKGLERVVHAFLESEQVKIDQADSQVGFRLAFVAAYCLFV
jgi:hypothetical protein